MILPLEVGASSQLISRPQGRVVTVVVVGGGVGHGCASASPIDDAVGWRSGRFRGRGGGSKVVEGGAAADKMV